MGKTRWVHEGFIDKHGNTVAKIVKEYFIWKNNEGYYSIERAEGNNWISLTPFELESVEEALEIIINEFKGYAIKCEECGRLFQRIGVNHLKSHSMTTEDYRQRHPGSVLLSYRYSSESSDRKKEDWNKTDSKYCRRGEN